MNKIAKLTLPLLMMFPLVGCGGSEQFELIGKWGMISGTITCLLQQKKKKVRNSEYPSGFSYFLNSEKCCMYLSLRLLYRFFDFIHPIRLLVEREVEFVA